MELLRQLTRLPGFRSMWRRLDIGTIENRLRFGIWDRTHYAYGVYHAANLAKRLGLLGVTVIELGVAGGRGLLNLEHLARVMRRHFDIQIHVAGFDSGAGLPPPVDFRDLPHVWGAGDFPMDVPALKARLAPDTELVLGNVSETAPAFARAVKLPIGFIAFDLDYYSSTRDAFGLFGAGPSTRLPRVYSYFDDLVWPELACHNDYTGEYLAIREYNEAETHKKLCPIANLRWMREYHERWNDQMYVMHDFGHPLYTRSVMAPGETAPLSL